MKNFLRALRHALPYRRRLILSIVCALLAAVLWGANFTSIYPVLTILNKGQSPHQWIDERITKYEQDIDENQKVVDELNKRNKELKEREPGGDLEKQKRDLARDLSKYEGRLESARSWQARNHIFKKYIVAFLPNDCFRTLVWLILAVFAGLAVKCFFEFAQEWLVGSVVNLSLYDLRNRFYRNIIHLDVDQFGEHGTSELMARFTNDMESLGTGIKTLFGKVVAEPLRALACVVAACFISWQLTLMFLILVPIAGFILGKVSRLMKQATRRLLERMSSIYKILQESFQGIRVVKAFTMEPYERRRFRMATRDYYYKSMKVVKIDALADPIIELLGVAAVAAALLAGSYLVLKGQTELFGIPLVSQRLEPEAMLELYLCLAAIADPVRKLSSVFTRLQSGAAAADRIFAFLDRQPRVRRNSDGPHLARPAAGKGVGRPNYIEFRDVCFSYEPEKAILTNINLSVRQGETLAVVGANGCGKTTLVGLVPRFYDPYHGSVLIDGHDIRTLHLRSLRQQIGVVTQEPILFDDSIYNNIAYGTRGATAEQVEAAARQAFAHDFIAKFPRGYQTRVGEMGRALSGGERQRLCLARVILRDPSVVILDEFTSAYDAESEALIHRALRDFMAGRTTFLITHRLNRLEIADRIVVLENGRIASVGTHAELLATCPPYQRLHEAHNQRLCA